MAENCMSAKLSVPELWTEKTKTYCIFKARISGTKRAIDFQNLQNLSLQKTFMADFPYLHPFTLKNRARTSESERTPKTGFSIIDFGLSDFLHTA